MIYKLNKLRSVMTLRRKNTDIKCKKVKTKTPNKHCLQR